MRRLFTVSSEVSLNIASEHSIMSGWDLGSDVESVGELIESVLGSNQNEEIDYALDNDIDIKNVMDVHNSEGESYRSLGPGCSTLCRFLSEHATQILLESGHVGHSGYVTPLHQLSIVPGHTIPRLLLLRD